MNHSLPIASVISSAFMLMLTGCGSDSDKTTVTPVGEKLYAQNAGLQLFYSQAPMPGMFAKFTQNGSDAAIALGSQIDLSSVISMQSDV